MSTFVMTVLENTRKRPGTVGLNESFGEHVGFWMGFSMGSPEGLLDGFSEWIAHSSDKTGWNLSWPVLILREAGFDPWIDRDWHNLTPNENSRALSKLYELLKAFLEPSPDGE